MKGKLSVAFVMSLVLVLLAVGIASAIDPVTYTDTGAITWSDIDPDYWYAPDPEEVDAGGPWLIENGDFSSWESDGSPTGWTAWDSGAVAGYEEAHLAKMTMGPENYGMGIFVRNNGGGGSGYFGGAYQQLNVDDGYYWVNVHASMFGFYRFFEACNIFFVDADAVANAVAWYAVSDYSDPDMIDASDWRELFPVSFLAPGWVPCPNEFEVCWTMGRYETVHVTNGQYFHLMAGHKFPTWQQWTVFSFDDIYMTPAEGEVIEDGFWLDGFLFWDENAPR
jgi:hypothetical protein